MTEPVLPLPDVPLMIEDLPVRARQLADAGAHREAIEEILDHHNRVYRRFHIQIRGRMYIKSCSLGPPEPNKVTMS